MIDCFARKIDCSGARETIKGYGAVFANGWPSSAKQSSSTITGLAKVIPGSSDS